MPEEPASSESTFSLRPLLDTWLRRLQQSSGQEARFLERHQAHLRQVLMLTALQRREPEGLWRVIQAAHGRFMNAGWVHTWACTLQRVVDLWPQLTERYPALADFLAAAWCAAGEWSRARDALDALGAVVDEGRQAAPLLLQQASLLWNQGHWEAAYRMALRAWRCLSPDDAPLLRVKIARLLLLAAWRLRRLAAARRWGQQALAACPQDQAKHLGLTHYFLFLVAWTEGRRDAEHHLTEALRCLRAAQDRLNLAHALADGTELWMAQGRLDRAEEALFQSYALWREMEAPTGLADYYRHAARVTWRLGKRDLAREYADYALALWQDLGHPGEARRCARLLQRMQGEE